VLEAGEIECERGGRKLFGPLSLRVSGGECLRIAGPNGSGKTSLLRILCGLLVPTTGEVRWRGERIRELREEYSRQVVYLGHAPAVKDDLTAAENLAIACRIAGAPQSPDAIVRALERLEVPAGALLKKLSQGQRRRAALARLALSRSVPLWLLDEPLAALDMHAARLIEALIAEHVAEGGLVIYTTHQDARIQGKVIDLDG